VVMMSPVMEDPTSAEDVASALHLKPLRYNQRKKQFNVALVPNAHMVAPPQVRPEQARPENAAPPSPQPVAVPAAMPATMPLPSSGFDPNVTAIATSSITPGQPMPFAMDSP